MPKKAKISRAQQHKIAMGKAMGKSQKEIAAAAGVSLSTVQHSLERYPAVRAMLTDLCENNREQMLRIGQKMLNKLEADVEANSYMHRSDAGRRYVDLARAYDDVNGFGAKKDAVNINVNQNTISLSALVQLASQPDEPEEKE